MKIQFCAGGNNLDGFENRDQDANINDPLPYLDESAEFILIEHGLEHTDTPHGFLFMRECHRILKPGGILRICVPTLKSTMSREHVSDLILGHGHQAVYNFQNLDMMLRAAGFNAIVITDRKDCDSHWKTIGRDKDDLETLRVEAEK